LRIALIARRFDPEGGGTERDLLITARQMREAGHEVAIFASEQRATTDEFAVTIVQTAIPGRALELLRFAYLGPMFARRSGAELVLSFARAVNCDLLRSGGGAHATYIRMARRWRGAASTAAMRLSPYHRVQMFVERRAFASKALKLAIAVSELVRRDLIATFALPAPKAVTLYNGVETDRFTPAVTDATRNRIRAELGIPNSARAVIFAGNGFARKGVRYLVESWPAIEDAPYLLVAGRDRASARYSRLAEKLGVGQQVKFLGTRSDMPGLMQACDALALPSMFEPFGNVIAEAMASGLPVLTSRFCGAAEVVPDSFNEFIVQEPGRAGEISSKMNALMNRMLTRSADLHNAARTAGERLSWSAHAAKLDHLLREAARAKASHD
jgi:UDP-glucose:(heptosyl)LPS alpha-1,3-glucosyltransferase